MLELTSRHVLNEPERPLLASWVYLGPCLRIRPVVNLGWYEHCPYLKSKCYEEFKYVLQVDVVPTTSRPYDLVHRRVDYARLYLSPAGSSET
ncbi:hypothetical protein PIB30_114732, partial [Stylosanthes scabra]|nr:hypothetical protein [Stylosanthes scabra]